MSSAIEFTATQQGISVNTHIGGYQNEAQLKGKVLTSAEGGKPVVYVGWEEWLHYDGGCVHNEITVFLSPPKLRELHAHLGEMIDMLPPDEG